MAGESVAKGVVAAANAGGGTDRVDGLRGKTEHAHESSRGHRGKYFVEARIVSGIRRLEVFDLYVVGFDGMFILRVVARI
jgi:hypothetical protein